MKFKVGDRVRVYRHDIVRTGSVRKIFKDLIDVHLDSGPNVYAHPKQCRRLNPKRKLREFWAEVRKSDGHIGTISKSKEEAGWVNEAWEFVHFREVRKKP